MALQGKPVISLTVKRIFNKQNAKSVAAALFAIRELKQRQQRRQRKRPLKITSFFAITSTHPICTKTTNYKNYPEPI